MTTNKISSNLYRLLNRNSKLFLLVLVLSAVSVFLVSKTVFNVFAQTTVGGERMFTKMDLGNEPVKIVEIEVGGLVTELDRRFSSGDDWLAGTAIKFKNISRKTITYVNFGIDLKEQGATGFLAGDNLIYGFRVESKELKRDEGRALAAGEVAKVPLSSRSIEDIGKLLSGNKRLRDIDIAHITLMMVVFDDGTRWSGGQYLKPDPNNSGKFIPENKVN